MSLDNIETLTIAPAPSIRGLFYDPNNVALNNGVDIAVGDEGSLTSDITLLMSGHKGLDFGEPVVVTRPVPSGVGDVQTVLRPRSRRFSLKMSAKVGDDTAYNRLANAITPGYPFTVRVAYTAASGKTTRVLPLCYYTGGLERMRYVSGRSTFTLKFYSEYPYFISGNNQAAGSVTPTGIRSQGVVWGVAATSNTTQVAQIRAKIGAPIIANDPDAWTWQWNPPGETPPATPFGTTNPSGMLVCFSPPYQGVYGLRNGTPLGALDVSSGRISGKQMPTLLPSSTQTVQIDAAGFNLWWWTQYNGI